jgi:hypothetical protein
MKRLLLVAVSILSVAAVLGPVPGVSAQENDRRYKINLGARGPECQNEGYVAPKEIQVPAGDVTIDFVNQQPTKLEVRGIPGGTFLITGNSTVQKNIRAGQDITFTTWLQMQDCKKATGHIKVSAAGPQGGAFSWILTVGAIGTGLFFYYRSRGKSPKHQQSAGKETSSH